MGNLCGGEGKENSSNNGLGCKPNRPDAFFHMDIDQPAHGSLSPNKRNAKSLFQINKIASDGGPSPVKWTKTSSLFSL